MGNPKLLAGLALLLIAAGLAYFFAGSGGETPFGGPSEPAAIVAIRYGSEKKGLLHDEDFIRLLKQRYNLTVDGTKMGSLEMAYGSLAGVDGLWPSSELAARVFAELHPEQMPKKANIFNTPIVLYTWPEVLEALKATGLAEERGGSWFADTAALVAASAAGKSWQEMGLPRQNGVFAVRSTDPSLSNSGFLMAGLTAVLLTPEQSPDAANDPAVLASVADIYGRLGYLENSTGILFDKYIKQGQGAFPLIAAYENLLIEFYQAHPDHRARIKEMVRVLLPEPTVWSEHPFLALTENGQRLLTALQDEDIQRLAWERYGFRAGVLGIDNDPAILNEIGLPERVEQVLPLPPPSTMERIVSAVSR